ncbi:preprotein translocase subunit SecA [Candidatus Uhrbacteria bacterium]|nr:preprotein translocase subunit SecA [Candidatus Uhrbacteria bacterium]
MSILNAIFGDPNKKVLKKMEKDVAQINALEASVQGLSDEQLKGKTVEFRERLAKGEALDSLLPEAFATVREAAKRTLSQRHFDVQLMGGLALYHGSIAEMRTGEGKTLTATTALYARALEGKGAHLVTVNDYLARRDAVWMGQIFHALGMTIGCIQHAGGFRYDPEFVSKEEGGGGRGEGGEQGGQNADGRTVSATSHLPPPIASFKVDQEYLRPVARVEAYSADITYGTNNEFGFDYLRDNMAGRLKDQVMRGLHYAIVDEVDSILIDEARTPLIISAPSAAVNEMYVRISPIIRGLIEKEDFHVDEKLHAATFTEQGITKVEQALGLANLYDAGHNVHYYADVTLRAYALYRRDVQYVVREGEVVIVDEFTGRLMPGRRFSEGIHQAIEAKEGVPIQKESLTLATITFQNYFRIYRHLGGMTGTAATEAEEFSKIYNLEVTQIPTHRANARKDQTDRVYKNAKGKFDAVVAEVKRLHEAGEPVLVGTVSIEKNELLGALLAQAGVPHEILNAKNHEREAEIIAQAGRPGAVTIATNMAGRGVDIMLGGNPPDPTNFEKVKELGGLCVIGTERHESRRIDNQLRGRSGRQGDPGVTQFYLSLEDDLMRIFGSDRTKSMMDRLGVPDDVPIENRMVTGAIERAQKRVEAHHFDSRKHLLEYDDVLNKHREVIYGRRKEILEAVEAEDKTLLKMRVLEVVENEVEQAVAMHAAEGMHVGTLPATSMQAQGAQGVQGAQTEGQKELAAVIETILPLTDEQKAKITSLVKTAQSDRQIQAQEQTNMIEAIMAIVKENYEEMEKAFGREQLQQIERGVILRAMDSLWIDHLAAMGALRHGIGLRGYGQIDPLTEYKREGYKMFQQLLMTINQEIAYGFFKSAKHAKDRMEAMQADVMSKLLSQSGLGGEAAGIGRRQAAGNTVGAGIQPAHAEATEQKAPPSIEQQGGVGGGRSVQPAAQVSFENVGRNDPCPCGSGKKYKKCHGA